jgi:hypothetical protein
MDPRLIPPPPERVQKTYGYPDQKCPRFKSSLPFLRYPFLILQLANLSLDWRKESIYMLATLADIKPVDSRQASS